MMLRERGGGENMIGVRHSGGRAVAVAAIVMAGLASVASATHYPVLVREYQWTDQCWLHEYKTYQYQPIGEYGRTWQDARNFISADAGAGWDLATVASATEQNLLAIKLSTITPIGDYPSITDQHWLGGYQTPGSARAAGWSWVTGEAWDYTAWHAGEPDDQYGLAEDRLGARSSYGWEWNDYENSGVGYVAGFVAERSTGIPSPGVLGLATLGGVVSLRRRR
jgi:MYXO-CTERM domain-containing protein